MHLAATAYKLGSTSADKLPRLDKMSTDQLVETAKKYQDLLNKRALLKTLRDGGQSLRASLKAVEAELERRQQETHSDQTPLTSIHSFEWSRKLPSGPSEECSDDKSNETCHHSVPPSSPMSCSQPLPVTRQLLNKCSLSERHTRFRTNQSRVPAESQSVSQPGSESISQPGPQPHRSIVELWADSALATPGGLPARTCLLGIEESLQLMSRHAEQVEDERISRLSSRLHEISMSERQQENASTDGEGSEDADSDPEA